MIDSAIDQRDPIAADHGRGASLQLFPSLPYALSGDREKVKTRKDRSQLRARARNRIRGSLH